MQARQGPPSAEQIEAHARASGSPFGGMWLITRASYAGAYAFTELVPAGGILRGEVIGSLPLREGEHGWEPAEAWPGEPKEPWKTAATLDFSDVDDALINADLPDAGWGAEELAKWSADNLPLQSVPNASLPVPVSPRETATVPDGTTLTLALSGIPAPDTVVLCIDGEETRYTLAEVTDG